MHAFQFVIYSLSGSYVWHSSIPGYLPYGPHHEFVCFYLLLFFSQGVTHCTVPNLGTFLTDLTMISLFLFVVIFLSGSYILYSSQPGHLPYGPYYEFMHFYLLLFFSQGVTYGTVLCLGTFLTDLTMNSWDSICCYFSLRELRMVRFHTWVLSSQTSL